MRFEAAPRIGLGTAQLGLNGSREDAHALLDAWLDLGGTLIDTAAVYSDWVPPEIGRSETVIGEWLKLRGTRNRVTICTKGAHPPLDDMSHGRLDAASIRSDVEASLRRLGTDRIDLYLLHRDDPSVPVAEIFGVLGDFVRDGKILATGVSNWDVSRIAQARMLAAGPVANEPLGNILCLKMGAPSDSTIRILNRDSFLEAESEDLTLLLYSAQCQGLFLPAKQGKEPPQDYRTPAARAAAAEINAVARDTGIAPGDLILAFLRDFSPRIVPLIGPNDSTQLRQSMTALDVSLDAATLERLSQISGWSSFR